MSGKLKGPVSAKMIEGLQDSETDRSFIRQDTVRFGQSGTIGTSIDSDDPLASPIGFWVLLGVESPTATYAFTEVTWDGTTHTFGTTPGGRTDFAPEANGFPGLTGRYAWIPNIQGDYVFVWHVHTCRPCGLGAHDLKATLTYSTDGDPSHGYTAASVDVPLVYTTGTDTLLFYLGILGAPRATGGRVWRSDCIRLAVANHSIGGFQIPGDPYTDTLPVYQYHDFVVEFFCDGAREQVLVYEFKTSNFGLGVCIDPDSLCDLCPDLSLILSCYFGGVSLSSDPQCFLSFFCRGSGGKLGLGAGGNWSLEDGSHGAWYGLDVPSIACSPLHLDYVLTDTSLFAQWNYFNEVLVQDP